MSRALVLALLIALVPAAAPSEIGRGEVGRADIARGDFAWERRAEGAAGSRPKLAPIRLAIASYGAALEASPEDLEARWKLLRALHFAGHFATSAGDEGRISYFERGIQVAEAGLDALARAEDATGRLDELEAEALVDRMATADLPATLVARLHFWSAIHWAAWGREVGLLGAVRQGVAGKLERYTRVAIALEPRYDDGAAYRLLGRLHAELPRVPFLTGWVDRAQAIPLVEQAYRIAPENPGNRLLLALTLLDLAPDRRGEALALMRQVEDLSPRPSMRIEDLEMQREAGRRLAANDDSGDSRSAAEAA